MSTDRQMSVTFACPCVPTGGTIFDKHRRLVWTAQGQQTKRVMSCIKEPKATCHQEYSKRLKETWHYTLHPVLDIGTPSSREKNDNQVRTTEKGLMCRCHGPGGLNAAWGVGLYITSSGGQYTSFNPTFLHFLHQKPTEIVTRARSPLLKQVASVRKSKKVRGGRALQRVGKDFGDGRRSREAQPDAGSWTHYNDVLLRFRPLPIGSREYDVKYSDASDAGICSTQSLEQL